MKLPSSTMASRNIYLLKVFLRSVQGGGGLTAIGDALQMQVAMRRGECWHSSLQVKQRIRLVSSSLG